MAAETARLGRDLAAAEKEKVATAAKLGNTEFLGKAPDAVVAKIRDRAAAAEADIARITAQIAALGGGGLSGGGLSGGGLSGGK